jgi:mono/diheme cytochrome c family protein
MIQKSTFSFICVLFFCSQMVTGNNWNVPADKKAKNSNIKFDAASAKQGEDIYTKNCVSCHGNPGKDNSLKSLTPIPPDLSSSVTQSLTDGELFYILTTGRVIMPSFQSILSEEERWKAISYIRSFNKNYVQVLSKFDSGKSKLVKINIIFDAKTNQIKVDVKANEQTGIVFLKNSQVQLFATRYFGKLQIDKTQHTDTEGMAAFTFPKDFPGDKDGEIELSVKLNDENYGEIESIKTFKIGVPTDKPALNANRAIWNVLVKAPVWIIFLFSMGVITFGLVIMYLVYMLNKLRKSDHN